MDSELVEGLHYSIMFYGGRLLCHLSANDPEVTDFISLRRLNRNIVVVIDSDKDSKYRHVNQTKKRVAAEFDKEPGFAWITKGREIENYVDREVLSKAVEAVRPGMGSKVGSGVYERALPIANPKTKNPTTVDKVKVAREVVAQPASLAVLDLKKQVRRLVEFIKNSNE